MAILPIKDEDEDEGVAPAVSVVASVVYVPTSPPGKAAKDVAKIVQRMAAKGKVKPDPQKWRQAILWWQTRTTWPVPRSSKVKPAPRPEALAYCLRRTRFENAGLLKAHVDAMCRASSAG